MLFVDWSSLPYDLISSIADCLLATSDLDYYMDFRAVCHSWRSATDDPGITSDRRFRPCHWVIIDEVCTRKTYLLVNTATGRFLRKEIPLLRRYYIAVSTRDGLLVLVDKESYHTVSVLNPFTGQLVGFNVSMPSKFVKSATLVSGSPPTLLLLLNKRREDAPDGSLRDSPRTVYMADPSSESFVMYEDKNACPLIRLSVIGIYTNGELGSVSPFPLDAAKGIFDLMTRFNVDPPEMFHCEYILMSDEAIWDILVGYENRCYLQESVGEILIIIKLKDDMKIFEMDTNRYALNPVKNIGNRAIFLGGCRRCMSVNADKFPSVDANCIYYTRDFNFSNHIHMYSLEYKSGARISKDISGGSPPYTIIQHLCNTLSDL